MAGFDLGSLLSQLGGGSMGALGALAGGRGGPKKKRSEDALNPSSPERLSGPALERYWGQKADQLEAEQNAKSQALEDQYTASGNVGMSIDQSRTNMMDRGNMMAMAGMPSRRAFLASLSGKKVSGLGRPAFQQGEIDSSSGRDVVMPKGRYYYEDEFDTGQDPTSPSGFAPGSIASRSGLSMEALRLLSGRGR